MEGLYTFIVRPKEDRYSNVKKIDGNTLLLNTELQNHQYVSRVAIVVQTPLALSTEIKIGDEVIVHHNVFRRFHDIKGVEKNSKSYFKEDMYFVYPDQVFLYTRKGSSRSAPGYTFVKPLANTDPLSLDKEKPLVGIVKYVDDYQDSVTVGEKVGFRPTSEYEFIINKERLYRVPNNSITIKYEHERNEEEYHPSWV